MNENIGLEYDRLLGEGAYGKVFLVKQQDGQQVFIFQISVPTFHIINILLISVADPGPLMLGVLDRWTPTVIAQISYHIELCPIEAKDSISLYTTP